MGRALWATQRIRCARKCRRGVGAIPRDNALSWRSVHDVFYNPRGDILVDKPNTSARISG